MSQVIKASTKQKWLTEYIKDGKVPDGYYVHTMKDGRVQFRKAKQPLNDEQIRRKISLYETKIKDLQAKLETHDTSQEN